MPTNPAFRIAVRHFGPFESAIRKQWESFEKEAQSGLTLELHAFDLPELEAAALPIGADGTEPWDVLFLNTDWVAAAYDRKSVLNLAPFLESGPPDGYPDAWSRSLLRLQDVDGFVVGLPYHDGPECLIYRRDLFEDPSEAAAYHRQFGQTLRAPETWSEFQHVARFFHRPERRLYGTVFAALPDGHNTVYDFLLQLWTRGGDLFSRNGHIELQTRAAHEALTFYRSALQDPRMVHPCCREMDSVKSGLAFAAGEVAIMVNWFGFAGLGETLTESKVKGAINLAPIPCTPDGTTASLNVYWLLAISADCQRPALAYSFLRHCAGAAMDRLLTLEGGIGCRKSTWNDEEVRKTIPFYDRLEQLHGSAREMPRMTDWPALAHVIDSMMLRAIDTDDAIDSILGDAASSVEGLLS